MSDPLDLDHVTTSRLAVDGLSANMAKLNGHWKGDLISPCLPRRFPSVLQQTQTPLTDRALGIYLLEVTTLTGFRSFEPHLKNAILLILPFLDDPSPNVRFAAFSAMASFSHIAESGAAGLLFLPILRVLVSRSVDAFFSYAELRSSVLLLLQYLTNLCHGHLGDYLDDLIPLLLIGSRGEFR